MLNIKINNSRDTFYIPDAGYKMITKLILFIFITMLIFSIKTIMLNILIRKLFSVIFV